jgi:hypothetical protein
MVTRAPKTARTRASSKSRAQARRKNNPSRARAVASTALAAFKLVHWGNDAKRSSAMSIPDPRVAELVELGRVVEVVYVTAKGERRTYEWQHDSKSGPFLLFDARDDRAFFLTRSAWRMTERGIVG